MHYEEFCVRWEEKLDLYRDRLYDTTQKILLKCRLPSAASNSLKPQCGAQQPCLMNIQLLCMLATFCYALDEHLRPGLDDVIRILPAQDLMTVRRRYQKKSRELDKESSPTLPSWIHATPLLGSIAVEKKAQVCFSGPFQAWTTWFSKERHPSVTKPMVDQSLFVCLFFNFGSQNKNNP